LGHHLNQKGGEAQAVKALVCENVSSRCGGVARDKQPVGDKALGEYAA
jgi:hypothetical protein